MNSYVNPPILSISVMDGIAGSNPVFNNELPRNRLNTAGNQERCTKDVSASFRRARNGMVPEVRVVSVNRNVA